MHSLFQFHSDEPTLEDHLEHAPHVEAVGKLIESCQPPYVLGIHGDWGSGKTSFLRKLHLYLAGARSGYPNASELGKRLWRSSYTANRPYETIWFEAWRYQFEPNPVVALLNEIRAHFTRSCRLVGEAGKLTFAALMSIEDLTKKIGLQPSKIQEGGERWEREQLAQPLPSQVCRDLLEQAIKTILGKGRTKRLIIFVDDLDRCQGQVAFRLLEAMKIYLSISSCIFVLGVDLRNVQQAVASELKRSGMVPDQGSVAPEIYAADYLSKLFQSVYHLPALSRSQAYLRSVLRSTVFGDKLEQWIEPMAKYALLPSNPRKIKSFVNGLASATRRTRVCFASPASCASGAGAHARRMTNLRRTFCARGDVHGHARSPVKAASAGPEPVYQPLEPSGLDRLLYPSPAALPVHSVPGPSGP